MGKTAVLVDGGFYRVRAQTLWGGIKKQMKELKSFGTTV